MTFTIDKIILFVNILVNTFSGVLSILESPVSQIIDNFIFMYGEDSIVGKLLKKLLEVLIYPMGDAPLYDYLFGTALLFFVFWVIWKFFIDSLPLVG